MEIYLIYTGEVSNGGHAQFFGNRRTKLIADIEIALKRIGCEKHAKVLSDAAKKVSHLEICTWIDWDIIQKKPLISGKVRTKNYGYSGM